MNAAIAVALLAEFVALIGHPVFGWGDKFFAATPAPLVYHSPVPPSGSDVLIRLAQAAAGQPAATPAGPGTYAYVRRQTWQLPAAGSGARGHVLPTVIESWRAPGGADRVLRFTRRPSGAVTEQSAAGDGVMPPNLFTGAAVVARRLQAAAPAAPSDIRRFAGLIALADQQPIPPRAEAVILELLARTPGVANDGSVIDRDGRRGVAVSVDSDASGATIRNVTRRSE